MFTVQDVYNGKNTFRVFNHSISDDELNETIVKMLFNKKALNYIFTSDENKNDAEYVEMLRRFIPEDFFYKEEKILLDWECNKQVISDMMKSNKGFYSFYAESLMAYLNYKILGYQLTTSVISVNETLSDQKTGSDACMFYDGMIILGEAKFYKDFDSARNKIIEDFSNKSLINKIKSLYRKSHNSLIVYLKKINETEVREIPFSEFINYNIVLSGFILHNKKSIYSYKEIDNISIVDGLGKYNIIFYHLPIESKEELIYLVIKNALEMIVNESRR